MNHSSSHHPSPRSPAIELPSFDRKLWLIAMAVSILVHITSFSGIKPSNFNPPQRRTTMVRVSAPPQPSPTPSTSPKPEPKPKPTPKPKAPTPNKIAKPTEPVTTQPIFGMQKDQVSDKGGMAVPVGNTMMMEDDGKRVKPEDVKDLQGDLSAPAVLIRDSIETPPYTDQAIDANLEGTWVVDVYVTESGQVTSAELRKKIGYGMDERVINAAKKAKFTPRKNRFGKGEAGYAEIKFTLVIP
jgi:TonB family protein